MMNRFSFLVRTFYWTLALAAVTVLPALAQSPGEIPLGSAIPMADATFEDVRGGQAALADLTGDRGTVVVFWSNQCPWVEKYEDRFMSVVNDFSERGIGFVLVNSNDAEAYPKESPQESARRAESGGYPSSVTYLSDPGSRLAKEFGAERTPHVFVFDENRTLVYVGTIDDSPGDPGNVEETYLRNALNAVVSGSDVSDSKTKAFGCMIKYKS